METKYPLIRTPWEQVLIKALNFTASHHTPRVLLEDNAFLLEFSVLLSWHLIWILLMACWFSQNICWWFDCFPGRFCWNLALAGLLFDYRAVCLSGSLLMCSFGYQLLCVCAQLLKSYLTLYDPMDYNLPDSSVHGTLQARRPEWVSIPSSKGSLRPRDWIWISCIAGGSFTTEPLGKAWLQCTYVF